MKQYFTDQLEQNPCDGQILYFVVETTTTKELKKIIKDELQDLSIYDFVRAEGSIPVFKTKE